jgi:CBS domain-containing protein
MGHHGSKFEDVTVADVLKDSKTSDLVEHGTETAVLALSETQTVGSALKALAKRRVLAAPVIRSSGVLDVLSSSVHAKRAKTPPSSAASGKGGKGAAEKAENDLVEAHSRAQLIGMFSVQDIAQMIFLPFKTDDRAEALLGGQGEEDGLTSDERLDFAEVCLCSFFSLRVFRFVFVLCVSLADPSLPLSFFFSLSSAFSSYVFWNSSGWRSRLESSRTSGTSDQVSASNSVCAEGVTSVVVLDLTLPPPFFLVYLQRSPRTRT